MTGRSIQDIHEERLRKREGLTSRGIVGCITLLISTAAAYGLFTWLDDHRNLRRMFQIPSKTLPDPFFDILVVVVLLVLIQTALTLIVSLIWRITGRDQKVEDKLDELYEKWDEIQY